jgi:type IV pilus assembly protein PilC
MSKKTFRADYLSSFCMELHLILQAGISINEGILLLCADEDDEEARKELQEIADKMSLGGTLSAALSESGLFPKYMLDMVAIGERTGNLDTVFKALSEYYDRQEQLSRSIRSAVLYPAVLLAMMLFVVVILVTKVLPIFNDTFRQLGATMSATATAAMSFGAALSRNWLVIVIVLIAVIAALIVVFSNRNLRGHIAAFLMPKLTHNIASARFASAMAMTLQSGLDLDDSLEMAENLSDNHKMIERIRSCRRKILEGTPFAEAISQAGIFSAMFCRMLSVGIRAGASDTVMNEIASRSEEGVREDIDRKIARVEPVLVIVMSVLVGVILLSVMLPLMSIMSSIG